MLTGLKVSSLACKCVFYRPELTFEGLQIKKKKNGVIGLVTVFTPGVMFIKSWLFVFSPYDSKINHSLGKVFKYIWKIL